MATLKDAIAGSVSPAATALGARPDTGPKTWQKVVGTLGDALQALGGGQGTFLPMLLEAQRRAEEQQQAYDMAEKQFGYKLKLAQWERDNPKPEQPTDFQRNYDWLAQKFPEKASDYLSRQTNDTLWRQGPDGQFYPYDPTPTTPTKPVGKLTPIPETNSSAPQPSAVRDAYIQLYGPKRGAKMYDELIGVGR